MGCHLSVSRQCVLGHPEWACLILARWISLLQLPSIPWYFRPGFASNPLESILCKLTLKLEFTLRDGCRALAGVWGCWYRVSIDGNHEGNCVLFNCSIISFGKALPVVTWACKRQMSCHLSTWFSLQSCRNIAISFFQRSNQLSKLLVW